MTHATDPARTLIGVGVGPGDPELVPLKAARILSSADVVLVPATEKSAERPGRAETIVRAACPQIAGLIERIPFSMAQRRGIGEKRTASWKVSADAAVAAFEAGATTVALATVGDPAVFSTFSYLRGNVEERLPDVEVTLVPGITAMQALAALPLPEGAEKDRRRLTDTLALLRAAMPDLTVTIDLVEHRGFEYQTGLSFTLFSRAAGELGQGGRYRAGAQGEDRGEPATGFTLYMDTLLRAVPAAKAPGRVYVPHGSGWETARKLRAAGWVTVAGLAPVADAAAEAKRLQCGHWLAGGDVKPVG